MLIFYYAVTMNSLPAIFQESFHYGMVHGDTVNQIVQRPAKCGPITEITSMVYQTRPPVTLEYWKKHRNEPTMDWISPALASGFVRVECSQRDDQAVLKLVVR